MMPNQATRVADAWYRATMALGYAITSREMLEHWDTYGEGPAPRPLANTMKKLQNTGVLRWVAGSVGYRRFLHVNAQHLLWMPPAHAHFTGLVLTALQHAAQDAQRYVSTSEVLDAMLTYKLVPALTLEDRTLAWQILVAAAKPIVTSVSPYVQQPGAALMARTTRRTAKNKDRGRAYWWCPSSMVLPAPDANQPATQREAVVAAVQDARAALGVPPNADELALYLETRAATHPEDPILERVDRRYLGAGISSAIDWIAKSADPAQAEQEASGLVRVRTPFTAGRLMPTRLALPPVTPEEYRRATASDALLRLQPGRELELVAAVEAQVGDTSSALLDLVACRRALLQQHLLSILSAEEWRAALAALEHSMLTLDRWIADLPSAERFAYLPKRVRRSLGPRELDLRAVATVLDWPPLVIPDRFRDLADLVLIGAGPSVAYEDFPHLQAALAAVGHAGPVVHRFFRTARRVPAPPGTPAARATPRSDTKVVMEQVDRADAYAVAVGAAGALTTSTYVADATALLGSLLRDPRVIARMLAPSEALPGWAVRGLLVAHGLLGTAPDPAAWVMAPDHVAAGLLGTVLADPTTAGPTVRRLLGVLPDACFQEGSAALAQAEAGEWLALVG